MPCVMSCLPSVALVTLVTPVAGEVEGKGGLPHRRHQRRDRHKLCALCLRLVDFLHWTRCINHKWQRAWHTHAHTHIHAHTPAARQGCSSQLSRSCWHVFLRRHRRRSWPHNLARVINSKLLQATQPAIGESEARPVRPAASVSVFQKRLTGKLCQIFCRGLSGTCSRPYRRALPPKPKFP